MDYAIWAENSTEGKKNIQPWKLFFSWGKPYLLLTIPKESAGTGNLSSQRCHSHFGFVPGIEDILELGGSSGQSDNNGLNIIMSTSSSFLLKGICKTLWNTH